MQELDLDKILDRIMTHTSLNLIKICEDFHFMKGFKVLIEMYGERHILESYISLSSVSMYFKVSVPFLLILVYQLTLCKATFSNYTDLQSLLAIKSGIESDPNNTLARNWTTDTSFCNWYGVTCSTRGQRVTQLVLFNMGLVGTISPYVGNLSFLTFLDLRVNNFHGQVVKELGQLNSLVILLLAKNNLTGEIPASLAMCRKLQAIDMDTNHLSGAIPKNLTTLPQFEMLFLGINNLTGKIPASFGNMSTLRILALEENKLHGPIYSKLALLPKITGIHLGGNYLSGTIPPSFFNISTLKTLQLAYNSFTGDLPRDTGLQLPSVTHVYLGANNLTGSIPSPWYNMSQLILLGLELNNFTGTLPTSFPLSLRLLSAHSCHLQGEIPQGIGTLKNLSYFDIRSNGFRGTIPPSIQGMESMQQLYFGLNELEGPIPNEVCSLSKVGKFYLDHNKFSGPIPNCIGNLTSLEYLILDTNALSSTIPLSLWSLEKLIHLSLPSNSLHGKIGQNFTTMKSLNNIDLSRNQLSGIIPEFSRYFQGLTILNLSWNYFSGPILESMGKLIALVELDLSHNDISGNIPKSLEAIKFLKNLSLSYNKLSGEIPRGGPFVNFTAQSFLGNPDLCGETLSKPCQPQGSRKSSRNKLYLLSYIAPIVVVVAAISIVFFVCHKRKRDNLNKASSNPLHEETMISYVELSHATNGFSDANLIGSGGFGHVYKGILSNGEIVAVKLLDLNIDGAITSFDAECKVLRTVRHRNLVKVITSCTNFDLRALVLEYIPNGSLEKWLYSHNYFLDFLQRVSIMLDVAMAMDYLHCGQTEPVIHCDLKPGNVLLDEDMVAHVADFGIAKILGADETETQTTTLGTFGYMAPEYGGQGRVSTGADIYSYGIMLLETFTRKKPTDEMFSEALSLQKWVSESVSKNRIDVVDENLFVTDQRKGSESSGESSILAILDLGLCCSRELPEERIEMKHVITILNQIKLQIMSE